MDLQEQYDFARNTGFVSVGTDHDTGAFAVASIRGWWRAEGRRLYSGAKTLMITADGGGSNGWRLRLWKVEMQKLADETGLSISVSHFPPGTSKWNKVEHRLFSFISSIDVMSPRQCGDLGMRLKSCWAVDIHDLFAVSRE